MEPPFFSAKLKVAFMLKAIFLYLKCLEIKKKTNISNTICDGLIFSSCITSCLSGSFSRWVSNTTIILALQVFQSTCSVDITKFPFDIQTCYLKFVAWSYTTYEVTYVHTFISVDNAKPPSPTLEY